MSKILLLTQDASLQLFVKKILLNNGYEIRFLKKETGLQIELESSLPDLILLDINTYTIHARTLLQTIKAYKRTIPVILILKKQQQKQVPTLFKAGANDFITLPLQKKLLLARIRARLTPKNTKSNTLRIRNLVINIKSLEVVYNDQNIKLTPIEYKLLKLLVKNKNRVLSRNVILEHVWGYPSSVETRVVDVYIGYLRKKIEKPFNQKYIYTVRGFGYIVKEK